MLLQYLITNSSQWWELDAIHTNLHTMISLQNLPSSVPKTWTCHRRKSYSRASEWLQCWVHDPKSMINKLERDQNVFIRVWQAADKPVSQFSHKSMEGVTKAISLLGKRGKICHNNLRWVIFTNEGEQGRSFFVLCYFSKSCCSVVVVFSHLYSNFPSFSCLWFGTIMSDGDGSACISVSKCVSLESGDLSAAPYGLLSY